MIAKRMKMNKRQTDRQTDRQISGYTDRQARSQAERQMDKLTQELLTAFSKYGQDRYLYVDVTHRVTLCDLSALEVYFAFDVVQSVECLPTTQETLGLIPDVHSQYSVSQMFMDGRTSVSPAQGRWGRKARCSGSSSATQSDVNENLLQKRSSLRVPR